MKYNHRLRRFVCLVATGGFLLQTTGCLASLAPTIAGTLESVLLNVLLGALFGGI